MYFKDFKFYIDLENNLHFVFLKTSTTSKYSRICPEYIQDIFLYPIIYGWSLFWGHNLDIFRKILKHNKRKMYIKDVIIRKPDNIIRCFNQQWRFKRLTLELTRYACNFYCNTINFRKILMSWPRNKFYHISDRDWVVVSIVCTIIHYQQHIQVNLRMHEKLYCTFSHNTVAETFNFTATYVQRPFYYTASKWIICPEFCQNKCGADICIHWWHLLWGYNLNIFRKLIRSQYTVCRSNML